MAEFDRLFSFGGHLWNICSSEYDGVGAVVLVCENWPELYAYRLASCSGDIAGILYLFKISMALRCSSSYPFPSPIGGPVGVEFVARVDDVARGGGRTLNLCESVCLYGGGGTKLIVYSSFNRNPFEWLFCRLS